MKLPFKQNLQHDVWNRLPASKYLLGRRRVAQLVERAVADWPMAQLAGCEDREEQLLMGDAYAQRLARKEFGSVMVLLFIGLITALVQVLLEWWLLKTRTVASLLYGKRSCDEHTRRNGYGRQSDRALGFPDVGGVVPHVLRACGFSYPDG
jgi:hypothetical protein